MRRRLFTFISAGSLLAWFFAGFLWYRGHFAKSGAVLVASVASEISGPARRDVNVSVVASGGGLAVSWLRSEEWPRTGMPVKRRRLYWQLLSSNNYPQPLPWRTSRHSAAFGFFVESDRRVDVRSEEVMGPFGTPPRTLTIPASRVESHTWRGAVPLWFVALLTAVLPALWTRRLLKRRLAAQRTATRRCAACGYDLRATPDRCPECGAAAAAR